MTGRRNKIKENMIFVFLIISMVLNVNGDCEPFSVGVSNPNVFFMSVAGPPGPYAGDLAKDVTIWCVKTYVYIKL